MAGGRASRATRTAGLLLSFGLIAASCAGDANDASVPNTIPIGTSTTTVTNTAAAPAGAIEGNAIDGESDPDDLDDVLVALEADWADRRSQVVGGLQLDSFGIDDDNVLSGPDEFEFDLDDCPAEWVDDAGVTSASVRLGVVVAQSGPLASFSLLVDGLQAYVDLVNARGGVDGRFVELVVRDDAYDPARAAELVAEFIAADDVLGVITVGSPGSLAVHEALNDACLPQPFVVSAHPAWGDPEDFPFTVGFELSHATEALIWGNWIKQNLGDEVPVTVGALVIDNDFGEIYLERFQAWADDNPDVIESVEVVRHPPEALDLTEEMAEVADLLPDVFIAMTTGQPCVEAIEGVQAENLQLRASALFIPSGCSQPLAYLQPLDDAGDGLLSVGTGSRALNDPDTIDDDFIRVARRQIESARLDPDQLLVGLGFAHYGWAHVELLRIASELPGGLSRSNMVLAMRNLNLDHPMLLDGVGFTTSGARDAYPIEGATVRRYNAAEGEWVATGTVLDLDGATPACDWVGLSCNP
ncbi:MAG: ABC transporter substrate-binding protein [Actinomycetota bacterium]